MRLWIFTFDPHEAQARSLLPDIQKSLPLIRLLIRLSYETHIIDIFPSFVKNIARVFNCELLVVWNIIVLLKLSTFDSLEWRQWCNFKNLALIIWVSPLFIYVELHIIVVVFNFLLFHLYFVRILHLIKLRVHSFVLNVHPPFVIYPRKCKKVWNYK